MIQVKENSGRLILFLPYLILLTGLWIYFGFFENYLLFFQEKSSLFILSGDFLLEHLKKPGAPLIYIANLLSAFYYFPLVGSILISVIICMIVMSVSNIIFALSGCRVTWLAFFFGIILFYFQTDYHFMLYNLVGILFQVSAFYFVIRFKNVSKGWIAAAIMPFVYFCTGGFALIFLLMTTIGLLTKRDKRGAVNALILWLSFIALFYIFKEYLFFQSASALLTYPFSRGNADSGFSLFMIVCVLISLLPLIALIRIQVTDRFNRYRFLFPSLLIIMIILVGIRGFSTKNKQYFHIEKLFYQNKYAEIISYTKLHPQANKLSIFLNNLALCETDQLNDLLFQFPQGKDGNTLFLKWQMAAEVLRRGGYFYYTIGMINEANRWAYENMVMQGYSPEGLKMLIKTELINGNYKVANEYIGILNKSFFYKRDARKYKRLLNDEAILANPELGEKRKLRPSSDFFTLTDFPELNLERILENDSVNLKALNYKLAYMLLQKDTRGLAEMLPKLAGSGLKRLPLHLIEAVVSYQDLTGNNAYSKKLISDKSVEERWKSFKAVIHNYRSDLKSAEPELRSKFGNSFWYYAFYR